MIFPEQYRLKDAPAGYATKPGDPFGAFRIPAALGGRTLSVIACDGSETGWEHVSVSVGRHRLHEPAIPTWQEMCLVKGLFWPDTECVIQFHPAAADYVNNHPGVLHLWRCVNQPFPLPPKELV